MIDAFLSAQCLRFNLQKNPYFYIYIFFNFNFFFFCIANPKRGSKKKGGMSSERVLKVVGAYNLLELVGTGNFGSVYRAVNNTTGETVAIKCGCGS
jgi:serine/threonine protein kinase